MSQLVTLGSSHAPAVGYLIALKRRPLDANSADLLQRERELMRGRRELAKGFQRNSKGGFVGMGEDGTQWSEEYLKDSEFIYSELERLEKEGKGTGLQVVKGTRWSGERDVLVDEKDIRAKCLIRKDHIKIGLMDSCDIRLKIPGVSRLHVTLDCAHLPTKLISHSTNPPFLSPHAPITRNEPVEIKNGTIINIYNRRFVYVAFASPPPPGVFDDDAPPKAQHAKEPRRNAALIPPTPQHKKPLGYRLESVKKAQSFPSAEMREEEEQGDVSVTSTIDEGAPEEDLICLDEVSPILSPKETESIVKSPRDKIEVPSTPTLEKRPRSLYPPLTATRPIDPYEPVEAVSQAQFEKEKEMLRARRERRRASVGDGLASGGMKRSLTFVDSKSKEEWLEGMKKSMTTGSLTKEEVKGKEVVRRTLSIEDLKDMEGVKVAKEGSRNSRRISDMLTGGQSAGEEEDDTSSSDSGSESSSVGQRMGPRSQVDQDVGSEEEFEEKHEDMEVSLNDDSSEQGDYATTPRSTTPPGMPEEHESPVFLPPSQSTPPTPVEERRVERVTPPKTPVITSVASIPHSQSFSRRLSLREKVLIRNGISATIEREKESLSVSPTEMATDILDVEMADGEAVCNGEEQERRAKAIDAERLETERQKGRNSTEKKVGRRSDSYADLRSAAREQEKMAAEAEEDAEIESTSPTQQRRAVFSRPSMTPRANYPAIPSRPSSPFPREPKANLHDFTLSPSKQNSVARGPRRVPTDSPAKSVLAAKARISGAQGGVPTNEAVIRDTTVAEDDQVREAAKAETPKSKFQQIRESILASRRQSLEPNDSASMFTASGNDDPPGPKGFPPPSNTVPHSGKSLEENATPEQQPAAKPPTGRSKPGSRAIPTRRSTRRQASEEDNQSQPAEQTEPVQSTSQRSSPPLQGLAKVTTLSKDMTRQSRKVATFVDEGDAQLRSAQPRSQSPPSEGSTKITSQMHERATSATEPEVSASVVPAKRTSTRLRKTTQPAVETAPAPEEIIPAKSIRVRKATASAPTKRTQGSSAKGTAAIAKEQAVAAGAETSESVSKGTTKETEDKENEGPASADLLEALPAPVASSTAKGKSGPTRAKKTELVKMEKPVTRRTLRSRA